MSRMLVKGLVLATLGQLALAQIDISAVAEAGPPPTPVIATNVPSQVIKYNHVAVETSAAAEQSAEANADETPGVKKRAACDSQWLGSGPVPTPDTVEAFQQNQAMKDAANNAPTPPGYKLAYKNLNSTANALGYMGFTLLDRYDVLACANKCNVIDGCAAININFERSPSKDPSPSGGACEQPPSTNLIKCVFWGGPVSTANAVNDGQWRNNYHVVNAGSNGYTNQTVDDVTGYTLPGYLGSRILNPPNDCHGQSSLVSSQYWNDGLPYDSRRCAAACNAQLSADPDHPCYFFNTYIVSKNGQPQGQYCAMYSQQWKDSDGTQSETYLNGDKYTFSYSYFFANLTNNGLPCGGPASSTTSSSAVPTSTAVTCPGSNGTTVVSHGKSFLIECFIDHSGGDIGGVGFCELYCIFDELHLIIHKLDLNIFCLCFGRFCHANEHKYERSQYFIVQRGCEHHKLVSSSHGRSREYEYEHFLNI
ncbi:hypothetical protein PRZ48_000243 [Zasmidium cellare]|uniref:Uncharacterized protein n=1 Tax=Zasmidium cellare TaxID=395010 RepID=A0ABR0EZI0_ZASCE|nr:hypothetical protein PRZ48_000243 [Zasmidium cellare]